jgi:hypothetical protein
MGAKIVTLGVVFGLIMGVGLVAELSLSAPERFAPQELPLEQTGQMVTGQESADTVHPGPSPFLLFSMGLFGIICVLINERKHRRDRVLPLPSRSQPSQQNTQAS